MGIKQSLDTWSDNNLAGPTRKTAVSLGIFFGVSAIVVGAWDEGLSLFLGISRSVSWDQVQDVVTICLSLTLVAVSTSGSRAFLSGFIPFVIGFAVFLLPNIWPEDPVIEVGGLQTVMVAGALVMQVILGAGDGQAPAAPSSPTADIGPDAARAHARSWMTWWLPGLAAVCYFTSLWVTFLGIQYTRVFIGHFFP
ncbi:hypothetical protein [Frigoribacterium sp. SL97]|uniref:hypothetical protein n=1 Tax=Frigoribacterium sp. SL97 TaxID=2994664 RepID=UPI00226ED8DA|nr:hypothetical protein [Frigoribacterium sp. SL97]WAC50557.1 hypothetical protein OVA02_11805 [Frigoribacterium sp. SL97]